MKRIHCKIIIILVAILILIILKFALFPKRIVVKRGKLKASCETNLLEEIWQDQMKMDKMMKVLVWTRNGLFGKSWDERLNENYCPKTHCFVTINRTNWNDSDALVFTWRGIHVSYLPPDPLVTNQKWVLYNLEPPHLTNETLDKLCLKKIDWIMSYRTDSDIYIPYGKVVECNRGWNQSHSFEKKTKSIAWFVNDCQTPNNREEYVKILSKYIDVDIYGKCGPFKCGQRDEHNCSEMFAEKYKFYLSFENSVSLPGMFLIQSI